MRDSAHLLVDVLGNVVNRCSLNLKGQPRKEERICCQRRSRETDLIRVPTTTHQTTVTNLELVLGRFCWQVLKRLHNHCTKRGKKGGEREGVCVCVCVYVCVCVRERVSVRVRGKGGWQLIHNSLTLLQKKRIRIRIHTFDGCCVARCKVARVWAHAVRVGTGCFHFVDDIALCDVLEVKLCLDHACLLCQVTSPAMWAHTHIHTHTRTTNSNA